MKLIENSIAINYNDTDVREVNESIIKDKTVKIEINGEKYGTFAVIDDSLKEFAIGYIFGEGLVQSLDELESIDISMDKIAISIKNLNKKDTVEKVESALKVTPEELTGRMDSLTENAKTWQETGGTHVAGIVCKDEFIVKEDVSRHVAVDKVIGYGILNNFDLNECYIIYSGRMPANMVKKLANNNIPLLASNAAPMASGIDYGKKSNVTMVGFLRGKRFNVYTNPERILF